MSKVKNLFLILCVISCGRIYSSGADAKVKREALRRLAAYGATRLVQSNPRTRVAWLACCAARTAFGYAVRASLAGLQEE